MRFLSELCARELIDAELSAAQLFQLGIDLPFLLLAGHQVLPVALQEIADGLDANLDRARGLIFIDVLKGKVGCAGLGHDLLDYGVDRGVVAALEAGELEGHQIRVPRRELRGPHFLRRILAVAVLPGVANVHGVLDEAGLDVLLE